MRHLECQVGDGPPIGAGTPSYCTSVRIHCLKVALGTVLLVTPTLGKGITPGHHS